MISKISSINHMLVKKLYSFVLYLIQVLFGIKNAKIFDTKLRFRRKLNLDNPQTLADKVSYLELNEPYDLKETCTDKYEVREYVEKKGLGELLVPVVGGPWEKFEDIDFSLLPESFALKATHGCKMNYIVTDKNSLDKDDCSRAVKKWLKTTYGTYSMEPHYIGIKHRIYAEKYLGEMSSLVDYKFHCLNGEPKFVLAITGRETNGDKAMKATLDLFDMSWNPIFEVVGANSEVAGNGDVAKPEHFDQMVEISRQLAADFKFVRVDLYELDGKVMFGELTFSPACCVFPYLSDDFVEKMGESLSI